VSGDIEKRAPTAAVGYSEAATDAGIVAVDVDRLADAQYSVHVNASSLK
jgi:hypothetical protein